LALPAGATTATFSGTTHSDLQVPWLNISASDGGISYSGSVQVLPAMLQSLTLSAPGLELGASGTGTVTLSRPAPEGGVRLTLSSDVGSAVAVPPGVTVPAGATTATVLLTVSRGPAIAPV